MSKGKKIFLIVLTILLVICALIVIAACIVSSMLFDDKPFVKDLTPPNPELVASTFTKISTSISKGSSSGDDSQNADSNPLGSLLKMAMDASSELVLDGNEINAIFYGVICDESFGQSSGISTGDSPMKELSKLEFKDGKICLEYPLDIKKFGYKTPFGSYINLHCEIVPEIKDKTLSVKVVNFKAGSISIPPETLQKHVDNAIMGLGNDKQLQQILDIVQELKVTTDSVKIKYNRAKLALLLLQSADLNKMLK